ncbi:MAG: hypothetical protein U0P45_02160 [Acidimicrobiales bacterium]
MIAQHEDHSILTGTSIDWRVVSADEVADHPTMLADLFARSPDGITLTGVFSPDDVAAALERFERTESDRMVFPNGTLMGRPIAYVGPEEDYRGAYLEDAARWRGIFAEGFGYDPHERIASLLAPMGTYDSYIGPFERGLPYNPGHVRYWEPGQGGLPAHIGNEFAEAQKDHSMRHLLATTHVADHLSYFVVLQRPEVGGALSVYDVVREVFLADEPWGDGHRDDSWIDAFPSIKVDPAVGDLVLFGGGWRWHRVDPVEGPTPRISYGGFCGPAREGNALHFWC